jgi:acetylornithine/succinyldiaminopimelate/putrescine aminotransferase
MVAKRDMKSALNASMGAEQQAIERRFAQADTVLAARSVGMETVVKEVEVALVLAQVETLPKVVRDSFTMPEADYILIGELRSRCLSRGVNVTKAEVLRAGVQILMALDDEALLSAMAGLKKVRTGRPGSKV